MNNDQLFAMNEFIDNPVVPNTQLVQSFELSRESFEMDTCKILR